MTSVVGFLGLLSPVIGIVGLLYYLDKKRNYVRNKYAPSLSDFIMELNSKKDTIDGEWYRVNVCDCGDVDCPADGYPDVKFLIRGNIYRAILVTDKLLNGNNTCTYGPLIEFHHDKVINEWDESNHDSFMDKFCSSVLTKTDECGFYLEKWDFNNTL